MAEQPIHVRSPAAGVVGELSVGEGERVAAGALVALIEVMKMEHEVRAPAAGVVERLLAERGESVVEGQDLLALRADGAQVAGDPAGSEDGGPRGELRADLAEVLDRQLRARDEGRPEAVERRHSQGRRTARENVTDLVDEGSLVEYGALALAAQRARRDEDELIAKTAADGLVGGLARVNGEQFGEAARCAVLSYDYTVLAGTQGTRGHLKKDRLFELIERLRAPVVLFAEGGGGRPGDTDNAMGSWLTPRAFALWGRLSGLVPRIAVVSGHCFAGNAALAGASDLIVATEDASIGMGGPAMIEGGGLGVVAPEDVGPTAVQAANGVVDVRATDDEHAVSLARRLVGYFQGRLEDWSSPDQEPLREIVPEGRSRTYDVLEVVRGLADQGSVTELRPDFGRGMVTALARIEGRPLAVIANDCRHQGGAITSDGADKAARLMQLAHAFDLPLLSLLDTPGMMVGPEAEAEALVRHSSRLFAIGANLGPPILAVVLRRGYGLGAQAMVGGSFHEPLLALAWPSGEMGPMGIEGAVKLGMRDRLEAIEDPEERERTMHETVAQLREHFRALNVATYFEIDDVVDPADTRELLARALDQVPEPAAPAGKRSAWVDTW